MDLIKEIKNKAKNAKKSLILPEGDEERNIKAARILKDEEIACKIFLLGSEEKVKENASKFNVSLNGLEIIDPEKSDLNKEFKNLIFEKRKSKGMIEAEAEKLSKDVMYFGACMLEKNYADALVTGAINSTGDMLRPMLQIVGTKEGVKTVSSSFLMIMKDLRIFSFGDCAVVPDPSSEQLADIAISSADTYKELTGIEPIIAMLSFSTKGSATHELVDKVIEATKIAKEKRPDLKIDGELQADAAIVESVGKRKAPESQVAGHANVLIFPDLNAGNIAYKLVQRLAGAEAVGPILQGLKKSANDLSRGCSVEDIVNVSAIALLKAK